MKEYRKVILMQFVLPAQSIRQVLTARNSPSRTWVLDANTTEQIYECVHPENAVDKCNRMGWTITEYRNSDFNRRFET
ncbi:MAG TPA: hypothetical protein VLB82_07505 [Thermodesulfobacteriota bacterium]|nr:hypothetical protein [Thermodesulfobacteriota bacterium]